MRKHTLVRYIDKILIKRRRTLVEKGLFEALKVARPKLVQYRKALLSDFLLKLRVSIVSPSDNDPNLYRRLQWGDAWAKYELTKALGELGYVVTDIEPDVVIHLWGGQAELPSNAYKIIWIYSHPETVSTDLLSQYDHILCLSSIFAQKVKQMGFDAEVMWSATSKQPRMNEIKYDVVFVGNARAGRRQIVDDVLGQTHDDMELGYNFRVWGGGYKNLPNRYWGGEYVDYTRLDDLYSSSLITLNDHNPQMAKEGFVAIRVFDILASGGFCISDVNPGLEEIFGDVVPQYHSAGELWELIDFFLQHPEKRLALMKRGREIALSHSWPKRASQLMEGIEKDF